MQLIFAKPHLSIKYFPTTVLGGFTLITGQNGAGKSHFLQALSQGHIQAESLQINQGDIALYTSESLVPNVAQPFSTSQLEGEIQQLENQLLGFKNQLVENLKTQAISREMPDRFRLAPLLLLNGEAEAELTKFGIENAVQQISELRGIAAAIENQFISQSGYLNTPHEKFYRHVSKTSGKPLLTLTVQDFNNPKFMSWSNTSPFHQQISRIFVQYSKSLQSAIVEAHYAGHQFSTEVYEKQFTPPWKFLEEAFAASNLPFTITRPVRNGDSVFTPKLIKTTTGDEVVFENLSSGEKTIMSFALCLYQTSDDRIRLTFPKLLLLDEIDAHLHPAMVKSVLSTITDVLVDKYNVTVVATTHSPTTVALSPEGSVFEMHPNVPGLHRITKLSALNVLTEGVPTLGINFEGKRQVMVESPLDAELHTAIYDLIRPELDPEISLVFLSTGYSGENGNINTGCAKVIEHLKNLEKSGNRMVWGLIDWDCKYTSKGRIVVLGENTHYSIENSLLDPLVLLLTGLLDLDVKKFLENEFPKISQLSITNIGSVEPVLLQSVLDELQMWILGSVSLECAVTVKNLGGRQYTVDKSYLTANGHWLETRIEHLIPVFGSQRYRNRGLKKYIASVIFKEVKGYIPIEFLNAYRAVCLSPMH